MHGFKLDEEDDSGFTYFHNGDFTGDVMVCQNGTDEVIQLPFADLVGLVAKWVRMELISRVEDATDEDILVRGVNYNG